MKTQSIAEQTAILTIKSEAMRAAGSYLRSQGFVEILPVLLSRITDPLHHETYGGSVDYYGTPFHLTKSMILHKQIALRTLPRVFCFSPNVRMEPKERASLGRYLAEFVQLDLEARGSSRNEIMQIGEELLVHVIREVKACCSAELNKLERVLVVPKTPFDRITYAEATAMYGEPFDDRLSSSLSSPAWVIDFPRRVREFYDREDLSRPETLVDMDLVYPSGYGEALSGGERETQYDRIVDRMKRDELSEEHYAIYLQHAQQGLPESAGFGIGVERLTRFLCGLETVGDARLFAKMPGDVLAI